MGRGHHVCRDVETVLHIIVSSLPINLLVWAKAHTFVKHNYQAFDIFEVWKFSQDVCEFLFVKNNNGTILKCQLRLLLD